VWIREKIQEVLRTSLSAVTAVFTGCLRFGRLGSVYRETEVERADLETVITDLIAGQFNDPVRVVAFNTLEHWAEDVSKDIAIQSRCDMDGEDVPEAL
jgi:hypothetical protein